MSWVVRGFFVIAFLGLAVWLLSPAPESTTDHPATPTPAVSSAAPAPAVTAPAAPPVPAISTVSIQQMGQDYQSNEAAASQKYSGMRLRTTGKATEIGRTLGEPWIDLQEGDSRVAAWLLEDQTDRVSTIRRGQRVTVNCARSDWSAGIGLRQCTIEALGDANGVPLPPKAQDLPPATSTHPF